ncbi:MAG: MutT/nudix family protein [Microgenomates group bacterium GW2011_GWA2_37_6]|nr:MAG: MutT/nudix family protein [Microgenomates group bacterium GW2011_GWA2_37_6]
MKFEFSAGGIVFRQAQDFGSKPQFSEKRIEILVCQHSQHHGWVFPKGLIGDHVENEQKEETAVREVKEETGIDAKIKKELTPVSYWYVLDEEKVKKTVYYFIMKYVGGDITNHDHEMEEVEWIEYNDVLDKLTYPSDKKVWKEARELVK